MSGWRSNPWIPGILSAVLLVVLIVLWAQDDGSESDDAGPPASPGDRPPSALGWRQVDLGAMSVTSVAPSWTGSAPGVTVAGSRDGEVAMLDYSTADGEVAPEFLDSDRPGRGVGTVESDAIASVMTIADGDQEGDSWWLGESGWWQSFAAPRTSAGDPAPQAVVAPQEEDGYLGAVGIDDQPDTPTLAAWYDVGHWQRIDDVTMPLPRDPVPDDTAGGIVAVADEVTLYAAVQDAEGVDVLRIDAYGMGRRTSWRPLPLPIELDRVTSTTQWDLGVWFAGRVTDQPALVYLGAGEPARAVELPDVRLDPEHPEVEILTDLIGTPLALAVQTETGPEIWVRRNREWSRFPAPPGRVQDGQLVKRVVYLVVDGELYTGRLPKGQQG